jgi:CheY-specific phosphatase CheX
MDATFSNPFLATAVNVLQTMALTETQGGKPCLVGQAACPDAKDPQAPERTGGART